MTSKVKQASISTPSMTTTTAAAPTKPKSTSTTPAPAPPSLDLDEFPPLPPEQEKSAHPETFNLDIISFTIGPFLGLVAFTLHWIGFSPLFIAASCAFILWLFIYRRDVSIEFFVRILFSLTTNIFFRELRSSNEHKIPAKGPVIFVCAPHANQFLDPAVIMEFVNRPVSFLIAAKSYRQGMVGALARAQRSIPVERPQDLATPCIGKVRISQDGLTITGINTQFETTFGPTDSILVSNSVAHIAKINSNTSLTLKEPLDAKIDPIKELTFKCVPKVNQNQVYKYVWRALSDGHCVGIFPEGGSHDRTELLPLKAGVALMALGAAVNHPGLDVKIITVGLNYFHGHRFRGRVYVEFGDPFSLPPELIQQYAIGGSSKVEACNSLLTLIRDQLRAVTVSSPSWEQLQLLWAVRRLYQPTGIRLAPKVKMILIRRFAEGYESLKDNKDVIQLVADVQAYTTKLHHYGLRDHQVSVTDYTKFQALRKLISRFTRLCLILIFSIPGSLLNAPITIVTRTISNKKAAEALKASNVKIAARDVLASWKVLTSYMLIPLVFIVYPTIAAIVGYILDGSPLYTWSNFAVLQPLMMWAAVRATETSLDIYRSLRPLVIAVFDNTGKDIRDLRAERQALKLRIRELVTRLGPTLYGEEFATNRLFDTEVFMQSLENKEKEKKRRQNRLGRLARGVGTSVSLQESIEDEMNRSFNQDDELADALTHVAANYDDEDNLDESGVEIDSDTRSQTDADEEEFAKYARYATSDGSDDHNLRESDADDASEISSTSKISSMNRSISADSHALRDNHDLLKAMNARFADITKKFEQVYVDPEGYKNAISGLGPVTLNDIAMSESNLSDSYSLHSSGEEVNDENAVEYGTVSESENGNDIKNDENNNTHLQQQLQQQQDSTEVTDLTKVDDINDADHHDQQAHDDHDDETEHVNNAEAEVENEADMAEGEIEALADIEHAQDEKNKLENAEHEVEQQADVEAAQAQEVDNEIENEHEVEVDKKDHEDQDEQTSSKSNETEEK